MPALEIHNRAVHDPVADLPIVDAYMRWGLLAAEEVIGANVAENDVGVGNGWQGAASAVTGRPGRGTHAVRADAKPFDVVEPSDAPAAGAVARDPLYALAHARARDERSMVFANEVALELP